MSKELKENLELLSKTYTRLSLQESKSILSYRHLEVWEHLGLIVHVEELEHKQNLIKFERRKKVS
jgi:hypothetical protein